MWNFFFVLYSELNPDQCFQIWPVAEIIDPWLGDKVNSGLVLLYLPASHVAWRAGTTALCWSWLYPSVRDLLYEFSYWPKKLRINNIV